MVIKYLIEKEFKQIVRNKFLPKLFFMLPTVMLLIMPWAANQEVKGWWTTTTAPTRSGWCRRRMPRNTSR